MNMCGALYYTVYLYARKRQLIDYGNYYWNNNRFFFFLELAFNWFM